MRLQEARLEESSVPDQETKSHFQLTRELELLISGALVFALLGMPGVIDAWAERILNHVSGTAYGAVFGAYYLAKLAGYALITTILAHFLLRGFWVALLGLRGVFPGGVDETRLTQGPFLRGFYERRLASLTVLEDRVDRIAASLFAFVFLVILMLIGGSIWAVVSGVIALAISRSLGQPHLMSPLFWFIFLLLPVAQMVVGAVDRRSKKRPLSPRTERVTTRVMTWLHYGSLNFLSAPLFFTFTTRVSRRLITAGQIGFLYTLVAVFCVSFFVSRGIIGFDSYAYFPPRAGAEQLHVTHYENLRPDPHVVTPTIQSEIITDPFIRLFVPYSVRLDNPRIERLCAGVEPFRSEGVFMRPRGRTDPRRSHQLLECMKKLYSVELDGKRLEALDYALYVHPVNGLHGRIAMIPARSLTEGRHMLVVRRTPVPELDRPNTRLEYFIPFWR